MFPIVCLCVWMCTKKAIILNLSELNATVTLISGLLFSVWLSHTSSTLVYIQRMCVAMNANPMSAIFIKLQTQSNISLSFSLTPPPHGVYQSAKSCYSHSSPTFPSVLLPSSIISLHLHNFLFILFPFTSLPLSFKLLICFGGVKWIAHRWPNFSVDFPKLISCCIPVWIPNENCVKIGKSLIRWNGKILFFSPLPSFSLSISLSHTSLSVSLFVMDGYSLFCGLLTRVETKFLICHTCLCSILERPETPGTGWSQTQTRTTALAWGTNTDAQKTHTKSHTNTTQTGTNRTCAWLRVGNIHTYTHSHILVVNADAPEHLFGC